MRSMPETVPEATQAKPRNGVLNADANPSLLDQEQFFLTAPVESCRVGAARIAALVKEAQRESGFTLGTVAHLAGKETPYASKAFDQDDPSAVLRLLAAVLLLDRSGVFLRGFARLAGREVVDRPRLTPEQERDRLLDALRRHGPMGEALIREAFGEEP